MADGAFAIAVAYVLLNEGSVYTQTPFDRGYATRYGITQATLTSWQGRHATADDVRNLTVETAKQIYKARYWDALQLDRIGSQAVATAMLDMAVLNGPRVAVEQMQSCVGAVRDGILGPQTVAAINNQVGPDLLIAYAQSMQRRFCSITRSDSTQAKFLAGWLNRATRMMLMAF